MSVERIFYCDWSGCADDHPGEPDAPPVHIRTAATRPSPTSGFIFVTAGFGRTLHFCGWNCLMKYAADQPQPTIIPWSEA
jgi:hypothetical protein